MTNGVFLREHIANLLQNAFAHVQRYVRVVPTIDQVVINS
jgi:hypothetical protein